MSSSNPFQGNMVSDAWQSNVDVSDIHAKEFETCCQAVDFVRHENRTTSVLIHGEPGAGKTHLLSRLRGHLLGKDASRSEPFRHCLVYMYLRSSAGRLWRSFRRRFVEELLRPSLAEGRCQLESLLRTRLAAVRAAEGDLAEWWEFLLEEENEGELLDTLDELLDHHDLAKILAMWLHKRDRRAARAWLRGEGISEAERKALGLGFEEPEDLETEAKHVAIALCRLASAPTPIVFCFDQIEALEMEPGDDTGLFQFGQMARELKIETQNVLLISCVQSGFQTRLTTAMSRWAYDSLTEFRLIFLHPLTLRQARRLMEARINAASPLLGNGPPRFSVNDQELNRIVGDGCTPRKLLAALARLYDGGLPDLAETPETFLCEAWDRLQEKSEQTSDPAELPGILAATLPPLMQLAGGCQIDQNPGEKDIEFGLDHPEGKIGVAICTQNNMTSLAAALRRLLKVQKGNRWHKLLLIRHPQTPIGQNAKSCLKHWDELQKNGAVVLRPSLKTIAALAALRELLAAAKSGDLSFSGAAIPLKTVEDWLCRELPDSLRELVDTIAVPPPIDATDFPHWDDVAAVLSEACLVSLEEGARRVGCSPDSLESFCDRHPEHIGLIKNSEPGLPSVLYRMEASSLIN